MIRRTEMLNLKVSATMILGSPGVYDVTTAGITLTLPNWSGWATLDNIKINDESGSANPNITIAAPSGGSIDGQASIVISEANESLTFDPLTGGNTWTVSSYNQPSVRASTASTTAAPTAPASTSAYKMQGLAGAITPSASGIVLITISGTIVAPAGTTVNNGILYQISYGTGTAPINTGALAGTQVGLPQEFTLSVAATAAADVNVPFSTTYLVTGLAIGTAIWIDLAAKSVTTASDMGLANVCVVATEQ